MDKNKALNIIYKEK